MSPTQGITLSSLVITQAPQTDIWPQGRTYPINASPITKEKRSIPVIQVFQSRILLKISPRPMWRKRHRKKSLAPLKCIRRKSHPELVSRIMYSTLIKEREESLV